MAARGTDGMTGRLRRAAAPFRGVRLKGARLRGVRPRLGARGKRILFRSLGLVCVPAVAAAGWLGFQVYQWHEDLQRNRDVLAAARQSAVNFTSLDYRHYERDSENVLKSATGDFKRQFAAQTEELTKLVADNESVSKGQVLEAGIVRADDESARVLVVADSEVTNVASPDGQSRHYRLQLDLEFTGGRWLTSGVEFVG